MDQEEKKPAAFQEPEMHAVDVSLLFSEGEDKVRDRTNLAKPPFPGLLGLTVLVMLALLIQFFALGVVIVLSSGAQGKAEKPGPIALGIVLLAGSLAFGLVAAAASWWKGIRLKDGIGFYWKGQSNLWFLVLALFSGLLMLFPVAFLLKLVTHVVGAHRDDILGFLDQKPSWPAMLLVFTAVTVGAPVGEEMLFRGLGFRAMRARYGFWIAAVAVSLVFAAVHFKVSAFLPIFVLSLLLCWIADTTGSVIPCIVCHAAYNAPQVIPILIWWIQGKKIPNQPDTASLNELVFPMIFSVGLLFLCLLGMRRLAVRQKAQPTENADLLP